jgi:hypothetical protein
MAAEVQPPSELLLRVSGSGQQLDVTMHRDATVGDIKTTVEAQCGLGAGFMRLLFRGKELSDDSAGLAEVGVKHRTKLMLLLTDAYHKHGPIIESINACAKELDELELRVRAIETPPSDPKLVIGLEELITQQMCKLDIIDTAGDAALRQLRKKQILRAEELSTVLAALRG